MSEATWKAVEDCTKKLRKAPFHDIILLQESESAQQKVRTLLNLIRRIAEAAKLSLENPTD